MFYYSLQLNVCDSLLLSVLRIRDVYPRSWIPDPNFFHPGSSFFRIGSRIIHKEFIYLTQKIISKHSEIWSGFFIPDPDPDIVPIPDPRSRGQKGTGSRIRILNTVLLEPKGRGGGREELGPLLLLNPLWLRVKDKENSPLTLGRRPSNSSEKALQISLSDSSCVSASLLTRNPPHPSSFPQLKHKQNQNFY